MTAGRRNTKRMKRLALGGAVIAAVAVGGVATRYAVEPGVPGSDAAAVESADAGDRAEGVGAGTASSASESAGSAFAAVAGAGSGAGAVVPAADSVPTDSVRAPVFSTPAVPIPPFGDTWADPADAGPLAAEVNWDRVPKPEAVRGIYVGSWPMGSARRLPALLSLADETEVNAFVIDIKDATGELSYASEVPLAKQVDATRRPRIRDVRALLDSLKAHGVYPIARIVAFKDPLLAAARPDWAILREDGTVWEDNKAVRWVDSFNRSVWDYNISLAREAIALGFAEVQWDYVRFPDVPSTYLLEAVYPAREGRTKADAIREFIAYSQERLADLDVPITADVFGIVTSTRRDVGIGQVWEKLADVTDVLLPMVYPSHYPRGSWGYPRPNAAPYQIVKKAMDDGVERNRAIVGGAGIRPWLQAFTLGEPEYTELHIRAQIDAVYDAGLTEWVLWSPGVRYPKAAFATADGLDPWFAGSGEALYVPEPKVEVDSPAPPVEARDTLVIPPPARR